MKPATASSFSRAGCRARVDLLDRRQQQRPALDEELVQHLRPWSRSSGRRARRRPRPRRRCRRRGRRGSPGGRRRGSPRRGSGGAGRRGGAFAAQPGAAPRSRPAVGLRAPVGERRQRGAHPLAARRGRGRRRRSTRASGACGEHHAPGVDDHRAPVGVGSAAAPRRPGSAATTKAWFSIARARSSTSQWSRPVSRVKAAGTVSSRAPRSGEDPVQLGEAQVVADAEPDLDARRRRRRRRSPRRAARARTRGR